MVPVCARLVVCLAVLAGCDDPGKRPILKSVSPHRAYTDRELRLTLMGEQFRPSYDLDPRAGTRVGTTEAFSGFLSRGADRIPLRNFGWRSESELSATLPPHTPPGMYDVTLIDPRGHLTTSVGAFHALGADAAVPEVVILAPTGDTPVAPGASLTISLRANDGAPGVIADLRWEARARGMVVQSGGCIAGRPDVTCEATLAIPDTLAVGDLLEVTAHAVDDGVAPNRTERTVSLSLGAPPMFRLISPAHGGSAGGTDLLIQGEGFFPGTRVFIDGVPLIPNGGQLVDDKTISGRAPAHAEGAVEVRIETPIGTLRVQEGFTYAAPPRIDSIEPDFGAPEGGKFITVRGAGFGPRTRVLFGPTLVSAAPLEFTKFVSDQELQGFAPPGHGRAHVWVFDPDLGWGRLPGGYVWKETSP